MDLDDFEQDFGKPKTASGYGGEGSTTATKKIKKGFFMSKNSLFHHKSTLCTTTTCTLYSKITWYLGSLYIYITTNFCILLLQLFRNFEEKSFPYYFY